MWPSRGEGAWCSGGIEPPNLKALLTVKEQHLLRTPQLGHPWHLLWGCPLHMQEHPSPRPEGTETSLDVAQCLGPALLPARTLL